MLIVWFGYNVTKEGIGTFVKPIVFCTFVGFLTVQGVSLHLITYNTIPWTKMDLNRADYKPDKEFTFTVKDHKFILPSEKMVIKVNDKVLFNGTSNDSTYGFGLFRQDNSKLIKIQVVLGHRNDILWNFTKHGVYTIRSNEYSGPKGVL